MVFLVLENFIKRGRTLRWQRKKLLWLVLSADPATIQNQSVKVKKANALKSTNFASIAINILCIVKRSKEGIE